MRELSDRIRILAMHHYTDTSSSVLTNPGINRALPFILLSQSLEEVMNKLGGSFKKPLLGYDRLLSESKTLTEIPGS